MLFCVFLLQRNESKGTCLTGLRWDALFFSCTILFYTLSITE